MSLFLPFVVVERPPETVEREREREKTNKVCIQKRRGKEGGENSENLLIELCVVVQNIVNLLKKTLFSEGKVF
jgi:hypothetical protein